MWKLSSDCQQNGGKELGILTLVSAVLTTGLFALFGICSSGNMLQSSCIFGSVHFENKVSQLGVSDGEISLSECSRILLQSQDKQRSQIQQAIVPSVLWSNTDLS